MIIISTVITTIMIIIIIINIIIIIIITTTEQKSSTAFSIGGNLGKTGLIDEQKLVECNLSNFLIATLLIDKDTQIKTYTNTQIHIQSNLQI